MSGSLGRYKALGLLPLLLIFGYPVARDTLQHHSKLKRLGGAVSAVSHPPGTRLVARRQQLKRFTGRCAYFAGELRTFQGEKRGVQAFYRGRTVVGPANGEQLPLRVVFFQHGRAPNDQLPLNCDEPPEWGAADAEDSEALYAVYACEPETNPGWNLLWQTEP